MSRWAASRNPGRCQPVLKSTLYPRFLNGLLCPLPQQKFPRLLPSDKFRRELLGSRTAVWRNTSRLLLWIRMHGRNRRFILPANDRGKCQQGKLIVGARTCGWAPLASPRSSRPFWIGPTGNEFDSCPPEYIGTSPTRLRPGFLGNEPPRPPISRCRAKPLAENHFQRLTASGSLRGTYPVRRAESRPRISRRPWRMCWISELERAGKGMAPCALSDLVSVRNCWRAPAMVNPWS